MVIFKVDREKHVFSPIYGKLRTILRTLQLILDLLCKSG